jgi:hypothetical protein
VSVYSSVGGDVDVEHGEVYLAPGARVSGDLKCGSGEIEGNRNAVAGAIDTGDMDFDGPSGRDILGVVGWILASAVFVACSVLAAVLAPRPLSAAARRAEETPGRSFLSGWSSVPAAVLLSVVLLVSVVGAPLLILLAPAYLALVFFGALVAAFLVGSKVVMVTGRYRAGNALAAVVGALALAALTLIPLVGISSSTPWPCSARAPPSWPSSPAAPLAPTPPTRRTSGTARAADRPQGCSPASGNQEAFCPFTASCSSGIME